MGSGIKMVYSDALTDTYTSTEAADQKQYVKEWLGQLRYDDQGNIYRFVKNTNGSALTANQAVCYDVTNNAGASDFFDEVVDPATANLMAFAGIAMAAIADDGYGWIQIAGINFNAATDVPVTAGIVVGDFLLVTNAKEYLGDGGEGTGWIAAGTAPTYPYGAVAIEAVATASTGSSGSSAVNIIGMR